MTTTFTTKDGDTVTEHKAAFDLMADLAHDAGFVLDGASGQTRSLYFRREGSDVVLRIADHPNYHPGIHAVTIEARLPAARKEVVITYEAECDGEVEEVEEVELWSVVTATPAEIVALLAAAIAEYDLAAERRAAEE